VFSFTYIFQGESRGWDSSTVEGVHVPKITVAIRLWHWVGFVVLFFGIRFNKQQKKYFYILVFLRKIIFAAWYVVYFRCW
jgi:hypothetical protein